MMVPTTRPPSFVPRLCMRNIKFMLILGSCIAWQNRIRCRPLNGGRQEGEQIDDLDLAVSPKPLLLPMVGVRTEHYIALPSTMLQSKRRFG